MKILRVVTNVYSAKAHLAPILALYPETDNVIVAGNNVIELSKLYPDVTFINIPIERSGRVLADLYCFIYLVWICITTRPDVIHTLMTKAGFIGGIAAYISGVPLRIHTFTGQVWVALPKKSIKRAFLKLIDKVICVTCTHCFTDSRSQSDFLKSEGITQRGNIIPHIGSGSLNGVDINESRIRSMLKYPEIILPSKDKYFVCTYLSRKSIDKGCIEFLKIAKILTKKSERFAFLYLGPKECQYEVTNEWKTLGLSTNRFYVADYVENHFFYIKNSHVLLAPSFREGFGSVVIDAASIGIPSVGYNIYGLSDAIQHGKTGFLSDVNNLEEFCGFVDRLRLDASLYSKLSVHAKIRVESDFERGHIFQIYYRFLCDNLKDMK